MPGHAKAVVTLRGHCPVRQEWWDVPSWQEGVEALVVSFAWQMGSWRGEVHLAVFPDDFPM